MLPDRRGFAHAIGFNCCQLVVDRRGSGASWVSPNGGVEEIPIQQGAQISFELSCNFASEWVAPFLDKGKTGGILFVDGILYACLNMQDGKWPDVNHALIWSEDFGATWKQTAWVFPKGPGKFQPSRF